MDDLISRQAAIDCVKASPINGWVKEDLIQALETAPSAQPAWKREKGKWIKKMCTIEKEGYILHDPVWYCSCCSKGYDPVIAKMINFCPDCGEDLRGEHDE